MARLAHTLWRLPSGAYPIKRRWSKTEVWERVFQHLADDADNEYAMIDSTIVRAHQHSAGALVGEPEAEAIGRSTRRSEHQDSCSGGCAIAIP